MSRNIKEIGKELLGKSLNSYHRKTGLTQLEKNNKMQDGILDGILSQVDDAYIEKTEQSNVIHLEGSGDGVVVLDSIEGNTMVNLHPTDLKIGSGDGQDSSTTWHVGVNMDKTRIKPNTYYTVFILNSSSKVNRCYFNLCRDTVLGLNENNSSLFYTDNYEQNIAYIHFYSTEPVPKSEVINTKIVVLEGDYTNCSINFIEGLQSSFEEKVNDEGKYEIEILMKNKNLFDGKYVNAYLQGGDTTVFKDGVLNNSPETRCAIVKVPRNTDICMSKETSSRSAIGLFTNYPKNEDKYTPIIGGDVKTINTGNYNYMVIYVSNAGEEPKMQIEIGSNNTTKIEPKQNKIKLLLNEPLRSVHNVKDRLYIKDNKLFVERNVFGKSFDGTESIGLSKLTDSTINVSYGISATLAEGSLTSHMCDRLPNVGHTQWDKPIIGTHCKKTSVFFNIPLNWLGGNTINDVKQYLTNQYNQGTPMKIVHILNEPVYEEVVNEYGEPIILEGYENGTLYIDSTILPTTTVRYTPKMESFKTLKEVENNNIMLTNDVNDNIIPYMMDVDYIIMEKELLLLGTLDAYRIKNNRRIGENDMTSMQKRTGEMLERLFRGKSLTEQEARERVIIYLEANKITAEQANYLNEVILEVYA